MMYLRLSCRYCHIDLMLVERSAEMTGKGISHEAEGCMECMGAFGKSEFGIDLRVEAHYVSPNGYADSGLDAFVAYLSDMFLFLNKFRSDFDEERSLSADE